MRTHSKHVLMCTGPRCTDGGKEAELMFQKLGQLIDSRPDLKIKRTRSNCFAICSNGPILVVYPEGVWYRCQNAETLERIVEEHLQNNREVTEHILHRLGSGDV